MTTENTQNDNMSVNSANEKNEPQDAKTAMENTKEQNQTGSQQPTKATKSRHRASVACATCRDRRIRVCPQLLELVTVLMLSSVSYPQERRSAHSANDQV